MARKMARSRFKTRPKRKLAFKNRESILAEVESQLAASLASRNYFRVASMVGVGGCGKTRLVDKLSSMARDRGFKSIRISLESEASGMEAAPLKAIRDQLSFECMLFDVALARYFAASGQLHALASNPKLSSNLAIRAIETGAGASAAFTGLVALPVAFAVDVFGQIKKRTVKAMKYERDEFEEIDRIKNESGELLERLPFYLGSDIERRLESSSDNYVFFYDSYEKQRPKTLSEQSPWLREFIGTLDHGLHIIASREPINWPVKDWGDICSPAYIVDKLPEEDVRALFVEECIPPKILLPKLIELSRCIPFYVEVLITEFHSLQSMKENVLGSDLPKSSTEAVERFISHLAPPLQKLVIALAAIQFFDRHLMHGLVRGLNLSVDLVDLEEVSSAFFVEPVNEQYGTLKTHDLLTDFVRKNDAHANLRQKTLAEAVEIVSLAHADQGSGDRLLFLFAGLCAASDQDETNNSELLERLIDIGYGLYDLGFWRELAKLDNTFSKTDLPTDAGLVRTFFKAISIRRTESVSAGLSAIRALTDYRYRFSSHSVSLDIETTYLAELSGDYGFARTEFARIYEDCKPFDPRQRPHYRALLYHADFLIMDGHFERGADALAIAYEQIDPEQRADWAELVRHRAHAFRFSSLFEDAEVLYLRALHGSSGSAAMRAKLLTNLAECRAWFRPSQAIRDATDAIKLNEALGNKIEVAKAHTANAIALTLLGEPKGAASQIVLAETASLEARYPAGSLFAKQASCLLELTQGYERLVSARHDEVKKQARRIGTYGHIACLTSLAACESDSASRYDKYSWIDRENILKRHEAIISRFKSINS